LAFFARLPNYGSRVEALSSVSVVPRTSSGSRQARALLQFVVDFYRNLPPLLLIAHDDTIHVTPGAMSAVDEAPPAWGSNLGRLQQNLRRRFGKDGFHGDDAKRKPLASAEFARPENCFCDPVEDNSHVQGERRWLNYSSLLQRALWRGMPSRWAMLWARASALFHNEPTPQHSYGRWPRNGSFLVSRTQVRAQPEWLFAILLRLTAVEKVCLSAGSIEWAQSLERLWFDIFDPSKPKGLDLEVPGAACLVDAALSPSATNDTLELERLLAAPIRSEHLKHIELG